MDYPVQPEIPCFKEIEIEQLLHLTCVLGTTGLISLSQL